MGYLSATSDHGLQLVLVPQDLLEIKDGALWLDLYVDGDHAGCKTTRRSSSGNVLQLVGRHGTKATVAQRSFRQGATAASAPESEILSASEGVKRLGLWAQDLFSFLLGHRLTLRVLSDSATGIAAIEDSYGVLKYMNKTQGVSLAWLHELFQRPDIMTKALERTKFEQFSIALGVCKL